jgi:Bacteriophage lambda head decoration protein D
MSGGFTPGLRTVSDGVTAEASFLASEHGMVKRSGITLDATQVTADGDGNKIVKAGTVLGKVTANGKYGPYDNAASDGTEVAVGFALESVNLKDGDTICGILLHGSVLEARCTGVDASAKTDLAGRVIFQ